MDICATTANLEKDGKIVGKREPSHENTVFSAENVILGGGGFVATASLMYRARVRSYPEPFFRQLWLDYFVQIAGSLRGGMIYLAEATCVYRLATAGSWTQRMLRDHKRMKQHSQSVYEVLRCLDESTAGKYHDVILQKIQLNRFNEYLADCDYKAMCMPEYRHLLMELPTSKRLMVRIGSHAPQMTNMLRGMVRRVKAIVKR